MWDIEGLFQTSHENGPVKRLGTPYLFTSRSGVILERNSVLVNYILDIVNGVSSPRPFRPLLETVRRPGLNCVTHAFELCRVLVFRSSP